MFFNKKKEEKNTSKFTLKRKKNCHERLFWPIFFSQIFRGQRGTNINVIQSLKTFKKHLNFFLKKLIGFFMIKCRGLAFSILIMFVYLFGWWLLILITILLYFSICKAYRQGINKMLWVSCDLVTVILLSSWMSNSKKRKLYLPVTRWRIPCVLVKTWTIKKNHSGQGKILYLLHSLS